MREPHFRPESLSGAVLRVPHNMDTPMTTDLELFQADVRKSAFDERSSIGRNFGEPAQLTYIAFKLFQIEDHLRTMASAAEPGGKAKR
jgi:hypothetical protein